MKYVYGPVPSRRLGQSLGIDPIPLKTCNWNCVYCQLGRTRPLVNVRKEYVPALAILDELDEVFAADEAREIDWITFVGSGEPTLHIRIGDLIREVKARYSPQVAVITNGSLLFLPEVRGALSVADAVLPSLDAGTERLFSKINRPHPHASFFQLIEGLIAFREEYDGKLWLEVMLLRDLNDSKEALQNIAAWVHLIQPDAVHLNLPTRPPAETWVLPADAEGLLRATGIFGSIAEIVLPAQGDFELDQGEETAESLANIISRHPMRQEELLKTLEGLGNEKATQALTELLASGRVQAVERYGTVFWRASASRFPDEKQSDRTSPISISERRGNKE